MKIKSQKKVPLNILLPYFSRRKQQELQEIYQKYDNPLLYVDIPNHNHTDSEDEAVVVDEETARNIAEAKADFDRGINMVDGDEFFSRMWIS